MTSIPGFPALITVTGDFNITYNSTLTLVSGFPALTTVTGDLYNITNNSTLTLVSGFSALINVRGAIYINNNPELALISGFENLNPIYATPGLESFVSSTYICQTTYNSLFGYYGVYLDFTGNIDTGC